MTDTKISALPSRPLPTPTDELPVIAGGVNYRSPLSSIATGGLYDAQRSGVIGDGSTDDRAALAAADTTALGLSSELFVNRICKVNSNLTLTSRVAFGPAGRLKPASGVTITLAGGFAAPTIRWVFDISLGGSVWTTADCDVSARNYGAVSDGMGGADFNPVTSLLPHGTDNRAAFQALIDCRLYFQKARAIYLDAGDYYVSGPLIVNYGDSYRSIDLIGAGRRYSTGGNFAGTRLLTDSLGNLIEIQGARMARVVGMTLEGPFYDWITDTNMGGVPPTTYDPYDQNNWISPVGRAAGALNRFKMSCGFHVDPRCGSKPVAVVKTAVRLIVTTPLTPTNVTSYEVGDVVQGVTLALNDRILFAAPIDVDGWPGHQANGVWLVQAIGSPPVRATDMDIPAEFTDAAVTCTAGTYAGQQWVCNNLPLSVAPNPTPLLGAQNIDFRQFNGTLSYADYAYPNHSSISSAQYGKALSSDVTFEHCYVLGFGAAFAVKGCDADGNADFVRLEYCTSIYCGYGFAWGHTQARVFAASNCQLAWSRAAISTAVIGRLGGKAHFSAFDSEFSGCVDILDIPTAGVAGGVTLTNGYTESGNRIGRYTTTTASAGLQIVGGHFGAQHQNWGRAPRYILDCDNVGVNMTPHMNIGWLSTPLIIKCDPRLCFIDADVGSSPLWMVPTEPAASPPNNVNQAEAMMMNSTAGVLFINVNSRQGPWAAGNTLAQVWSPVTPYSRGSRYLGHYTPSSVTAPIPFFAHTTASEGGAIGAYGPSASPLPVALGYMGAQFILNGTTHISSWSEAVVTPAAPGLPRTVLTFTLSGVFTVGTAQNCGLVPGSIILNRNTGNLYLIQTCNITTRVITAELLNNYGYSTGIGYTPAVLSDILEFYPCGHYLPNYGLELTWANGSDTVTYKRPDGAITDGAQLPVGAAMMTNEFIDPLTPIIRSRSAIKTSSVAGTIVFDGLARATVPVPIQRAGIFFMPRVIDV